MFVEIAVNLSPVQGTFHYHLPPELDGLVRPGHLVTAPFGRQRVQGIVLRLLDEADVPETRPVEALLDPDPVLTEPQLALAHWLQASTLAPLVDCLTLMLPPGLSQQADSLYTLVDADVRPETPAQARLISLLSRRGPLRGRQLERSLGRLNWRPAADALVRCGAISRLAILAAPKVRPRQVHTVELAVDGETALAAFTQLGRPGSPAALRRSKAIEALSAETEPVEVSWIYAEAGCNLSDLRALESRGLVALGEREAWRDPLADLDFVPSHAPPLTRDQQAAWEPISAALADVSQGRPHPPFLLHGVTGSGKTEIYLRAVEDVLTRGRQAVVLVPEIALTPQTLGRFAARFGRRVGVLHSQLTPGQRYDTWRRARAGSLDVLVGPRSALFAPLPRLSLIILDEAHDESYKEQGQSPRYDARRAAMAHANRLPAVCLLGTATPDLVTAYEASRGQIRLLRLPQRILGHRQRLAQQTARLGLASRYRPESGEAQAIDLPPVHIVDMRQELRAGNASLFSRTLFQALADAVNTGQQAILFLNRRGASTYVFCRDCGESLTCPRCDTPLVHHTAREQLQCHHCGYRRGVPETCPACGSPRVRHFGAGTQRVESEVQRLLPQARTLRWDWDVTRSPGAHDVILSHFANHRADVLVGTQMIAKSLDLPLVTLVGVVSADTGLHLPDFRAAERTFQVLTQVAGRAGRGLLGGQVILQTYLPNHPVIRAAANHDYATFYEHELRTRRELGYPPFRRLVRLVFQHPRADQAEAEAIRLGARLEALATRSGQQVELIGPVPCFFRKIRGLHRWQIVLRGADPVPLVPQPLPEGWTVDVDPVSLL
jgi:primosomal protein N' (replication factor Y)